jgi:hypothetical protein
MARDRTMTMVKSEIVLSIISNNLGTMRKRQGIGRTESRRRVVSKSNPSFTRGRRPDQFTQCNTLRITDQRGALGRASRPRIQWS